MAPFGQLLFDFLMQAIGKVPSMPGLMDGFPPAPQSRVTLANWQDPPFNRWAFRHVREIIPTQPIPAGPAGAAPLAASRRAAGGAPVGRPRPRLGRPAGRAAERPDGRGVGRDRRYLDRRADRP